VKTYLEDLGGSRGSNPVTSKILYPKEQTITLDGDTIAYVNPQDKFGADMVADRRKDYLIYKEFKREGILSEGSTFIDLGAHWGTHSLYVRKIIGQNGNIFAAEPNPENVELLEKSIEENSIKNIEPINVAVTSSVGQSDLMVPGQSSMSALADYDDFDSYSKIQVETTTIDKIIERKDISSVDLLKMDIQGAEADAIKGMHEAVELIEHMYIDFHSGQVSETETKEFFDWLDQRGELYFVEDSKIQWDKRVNQPDQLTGYPELLWVNDS
jgi:FkbM family methyltransferase